MVASALSSSQFGASMAPAKRLHAKVNGSGERSHNVTLCPRSASKSACQRPTTPAPRIAIDFGFCAMADFASIPDRQAFTPFVGAAFEALVGHGDDMESAGERYTLYLMSELAYVSGEPIEACVRLENKLFAG